MKYTPSYESYVNHCINVCIFTCFQSQFLYFYLYSFSRFLPVFSADLSLVSVFLSLFSADLNSSAVFFCGVFAGFCYCVTHPIESVKTRVQVMSAVSQTKGFFGTFWNIVKTEGNLLTLFECSDSFGKVNVEKSTF